MTRRTLRRRRRAAKAPGPADAPGTPGATDPGPTTSDTSEVDTSEVDTSEVARLRSEVTALRGKLDTRARRHRTVQRARAILAAILVALAGFGVVLSVLGIWGARTVFNTDRWVATVAPLSRDPQVNAAVATYLSTELQRTVNLQQRVADALPPEAAFLAAPVGGAVRDYLQQTIERLLATPQFQALWEDANRRAQPRLVAVLEDRSDVVSTQGDEVTLNLLPIVNNALVQVDQALPNIFGKQITLPTVTSGQIPPDLRERIQTQLGVTLPADFANIEISDRGRLAQVQDAVATAKRMVVRTVVGTVLVLVLAFVVSVNRRRTALQFGLWLALATVVLGYALRLESNRLLQNVPAGTYRDGASAALQTIVSTLRERGDQLFWLGLIIAVLAYLAGPGRSAVALRRYVARGTRRLVTATRDVATGPQLRIWAHRHLDPVRIGGVVIAAVVALAFSSWIALLVIVIVLVGFEVGVTMLARSGAELDEAAVEPVSRPEQHPA